MPEPTAESLLARLGSLDVAMVGDDATALDALSVMAARDKGAVAVVSRAGLVGIFSERDHARSSLSGTTSDRPVVDVMTRCVACVAPADSVRRCLTVITERHMTHVAVLDGGLLAGLLSEADLMTAQAAYLERIIQETELDQKLLFLRGVYSC